MSAHLLPNIDIEHLQRVASAAIENENRLTPSPSLKSSDWTERNGLSENIERPTTDLLSSEQSECLSRLLQSVHRLVVSIESYVKARVQLK